MRMKAKHKKEQLQIANALFELGMDFEVIENICGVDATDLLLNKAGLLDCDEETVDSKRNLDNPI